MSGSASRKDQTSARPDESDDDRVDELLERRTAELRAEIDDLADLENSCWRDSSGNNGSFFQKETLAELLAYLKGGDDA